MWEPAALRPQVYTGNYTVLGFPSACCRRPTVPRLAANGLPHTTSSTFYNVTRARDCVQACKRYYAHQRAMAPCRTLSYVMRGGARTISIGAGTIRLPRNHLSYIKPYPKAHSQASNSPHKHSFDPYDSWGDKEMESSIQQATRSGGSQTQHHLHFPSMTCCESTHLRAATAADK
jgi:hypothetical protein